MRCGVGKATALRVGEQDDEFEGAARPTSDMCKLSPLEQRVRVLTAPSDGPPTILNFWRAQSAENKSMAKSVNCSLLSCVASPLIAVGNVMRGVWRALRFMPPAG
jgi:hypothetical protein